MAAELTIYEVSSCSTCRKLSALLAERGVKYEGVEYHETGLTEGQIRDLLDKAGLRPRDVLRMREPLVAERGGGAAAHGFGEDQTPPGVRRLVVGLQGVVLVEGEVLY